MNAAQYTKAKKDFANLSKRIAILRKCCNLLRQYRTKEGRARALYNVHKIRKETPIVPIGTVRFSDDIPRILYSPRALARIVRCCLNEFEQMPKVQVLHSNTAEDSSRYNIVLALQMPSYSESLINSIY